MEDMNLSSLTVLVTGCCGTVGDELISYMLNSANPPRHLIGIDINETAIFLQRIKYSKFHQAEFYVGDIRDRDLLLDRFRGVDILFHTAALKHVGLGEDSPDQVVLTNIEGLQNVIFAAKSNQLRRVVFTSSDKAVNPTNVMGATKLLGERLISAADNGKHDDGTIFTNVRFGNILSSNGSVLPIFLECLSLGKPLPVTDIRMSRFVMSPREAIILLLKACFIARGGEVFVMKMPAVRIVDLAEALQEDYFRHGAPQYLQPNLELTGCRPGEKTYEELISEEEAHRTLLLDDFYVIPNSFSRKARYDSNEFVKASRSKGDDQHSFSSRYSSYLTKEEIIKYLDEQKLLSYRT
jgi:FlaA1/EpsC-like NDP-sugar epimerase